MQDAWQIGRLFGIPLRVHVSWLIVFGLVAWSLASAYFPAVIPNLPAWSYWTTAIVAALLLFGSILLHELGHAVVARRRGVAISGITLFVFGGVAQMTEEPRDPRHELGIALVGPAVSLVLGGFFGALVLLVRAVEGSPTLIALLGYLSFVNVLVAVFNMLPAFPLDGGRVLRAVLWLRHGDQARATRRAADVGRAVAFGILGLGVLQLLAGNFGGLWLVLIGWFVMQAGTAGAAQASLRQALGGLRVRDVMTTEVQTVPADTTVDDLIERYFMRHTYGGYPVIRDGAVVGLVTLRDLRDTPEDRRAVVTVETAMRPLEDTFVVEPDTLVAVALDTMLARQVRRAVVLERGRLTGLVTTNGIMHLAQVRRVLGG